MIRYKFSLDIHAIPQHMTKEFDVVLSNFSWRYFMYPDIAFFNVLSLLKQNGIAALDVENLCSIGPYRIVLELLISQNIKEVDDAPVRQREWFARVTQIEDLLIGFSNLGMLEWLHPYRKINLMFRKDEDAPPYAGGLFFRLLAPQDEVQSFINDSRKKFLDEWKSSLTAIKHADNIRQEYRENPRYALLREAVGTMFGFD